MSHFQDSASLRLQTGSAHFKLARDKWVAKFTGSASMEEAYSTFVEIFMLDLYLCTSLQQFIQSICIKEQDLAKRLNINLDLSPDEKGYFDLVRYCIKIAKVKHGNGVREKTYPKYYFLYRNEDIDELKLQAYKKILEYLEGDEVALTKVMHKIANH